MSNGGATRKAGFTLVELLVVIAILAILAALLLPALSRSKMQASPPFAWAMKSNCNWPGAPTTMTITGS